MAHLFSKIVIGEAIRNIQIPDIEKKVALLKDWLDMYNSGNLQKKSEKEFEGVYNESLFGNILGYTSASSGEYTREKEPRNESNGQKCDIGLGFYTSENSTTQAVVELKDAATSLDRPQQRAGNLTPVQQAFKYKPLYNSKWVIVSNFFEIRLYTDTYQDFESFTLRELVDEKNNYENFRKFYAIFHATRLISKNGESETERLLAKVRIDQEVVSKKFYKEYSLLREELMRDIWKNNPKLKNEGVIIITQRIIDRIVFIHFCEDRTLLPENKLKENLERAREIDITPWEMLCRYFRGIDKGSEKLGIPNGYNGGLFHDEDDTINRLIVSDNIITKFIELGRYDFSDNGGELSVEILGHIFEQSISDLEAIRAKIQNQGKEITETEKKVSKRKKDGIFYTPAYIVDYIVRNSLGKYLEEHEESLKTKYNLKADITEKNYRKRELEAYTEYQKILQNVKVLDPACGSGAFLVRVFDFLLEENLRVDRVLQGDNQTMSLIEKDPSAFFGEILKNNIYGVDLNEESVEITKLSLWLKSAVKGKKLVTLDDNIKCGNSLIDDPAVAGDKAFDWNREFVDIMASGGFDVIVGNPPYVLSREDRFKKEKKFFGETYKLFHEKPNLYILFMEKGDNLLKKNGYLGFIVPNSWLGIDSGVKIRKYLLENTAIKKIINLKGESFAGVSVETSILLYSKHLSKNEDLIFFATVNGVTNFDASLESVNKNQWLQNRNYIFDVQSDDIDSSILNKIATFKPLEELYDVRVGLQAYEKGKGFPKQTEDDVKNHIFDFDYKYDETTYPYLGGSDVSRYSYSWSGQWLKHGKWLSQPKELEQFLKPRILIREITSKYPHVLNAMYFEEAFLNNKSIINILSAGDFSLKFLLCILNSQTISFYHSRLAVKGNRTLFPKVVVKDVQNYPIPNISLTEQRAFIDQADTMLTLNRELHDKSDTFLKNISAKYKIEKVTRKLEKWWELDFADFVRELKAKLGLEEQEELISYFDKRKAEVSDIVARIETTDKEIDEMVFELYGLTEEERRVVLESNGK